MQHVIVDRPRRLVPDLVAERLAPEHGRRGHVQGPVEGDALAGLDLLGGVGDDGGGEEVQRAELVGCAGGVVG